MPVVLLLSSYIFIRHRQHVHWPLFFKAIPPGMTIGLIIGQLVFFQLQTEWLKRVLGLLIIVLAARELLPRRQLSAAPPMLPWTLAAGIVHGIFATGGPLLVYAMNAQKLSKAQFRATLSLFWLAMALMLIASLIASGKLTLADSSYIGALLMMLTTHIVIGEWIRSRVNAELLTRLINLLLLIAGLLLLRG